MNQEPTVLDYLKSLFRGKPLAIPSLEETPQVPELAQEPLPEQPAEVFRVSTPAAIPERSSPRITLPWRSLLALAIALAAQISLQPRPNRTWIPGVILYLMAAGWLVWAAWKGEWTQIGRASCRGRG